jgi:uncharacterized protein (DUF39 family)/Pyruvate/2-oxoacid:ferredoxin oxidoreductase delta subunit
LTKTINEINKKIAEGNAVVITAEEMKAVVAELGSEEAAVEVDVVTTGTFGAMCSSGVWLNFGHADPPIKINKTWLNGVEAYSGIAAVDAYLGATQSSTTLEKYGGGHVIEDLVRGKAVHLKAKGCKTDCYPREELDTDITLANLNQAIMSNPRNCYERYNAASNSGSKNLYTYMGQLLPHNGNVNYSGAGEFSPINNDPSLQTIGIGTRIFLGGGTGYIVGNGTQHNPDAHFSTLMVQGNLKEMSADFIRGAFIQGYGCSLYIGIGVPIPILNSSLAKSAARTNEQIFTEIIDYSVPSRDRPSLGTVSYAELQSGEIELNNRSVKTAPISSLAKAKEIALILKQKITKKQFYLSQAVQHLETDCTCNPLKANNSLKNTVQHTTPKRNLQNSVVIRDEKRCIHCGLCTAYCPSNVFVRMSDWKISTDTSNCTACHLCDTVCPQQAISHY